MEFIKLLLLLLLGLLLHKWIITLPYAVDTTKLISQKNGNWATPENWKPIKNVKYNQYMKRVDSREIRKRTSLANLMTIRENSEYYLKYEWHRVEKVMEKNSS